MRFEFDAENHVYKLDGEKLPSVTEVLPKQKFWCSPDQLEAARQEGEDNHNLIRMFFDSDGDTFGEDMLIDLKEWLKKNKGIIGDLIQYESPLFSAKNKFAGIPDAVFKNAIVDFKRSRGDAKRLSLQLAGYSILAKENKIIKKSKNWLIVYRTKTGFRSMNINESGIMEQAEDIFLDLVRKWHIDNRVNNYFNGGINE